MGIRQVRLLIELSEKRKINFIKTCSQAICLLCQCVHPLPKLRPPSNKQKYRKRAVQHLNCSFSHYIVGHTATFSFVLSIIGAAFRISAAAPLSIIWPLSLKAVSRPKLGKRLKNHFLTTANGAGRSLSRGKRTLFRSCIMFSALGCF